MTHSITEGSGNVFRDLNLLNEAVALDILTALGVDSCRPNIELVAKLIAAAIRSAVEKERARSLEKVSGEFKSCTLGDELVGRITEADALKIMNEILGPRVKELEAYAETAQEAWRQLVIMKDERITALEKALAAHHVQPHAAVFAGEDGNRLCALCGADLNKGDFANADGLSTKEQHGLSNPRPILSKNSG